MGNLSQDDNFFTPQQEQVFSVSLISKALKDVVEGTFSGIRVKGEVQGLKKHTSGHIYFSLKDTDAVMDAVCWRGTPQTNLLREGLEIVAYGKITTYPGRSKYQMIISSFEASGEGALLQLLQKLKEQLHKEGLFSPEHKKPIPSFPRRIGIITSPTGAVIRDILHRLRERYPCHILLKSVAVQGEGAAFQVCEAVRMMNALPDEKRPDVLIIARGGGSLEDLFAFNDEALVREVFKSEIPVISAIGHETDFTLLDFVADLRAPTPTAAAELATPVMAQILLRLQEIDVRLKQTLMRTLHLLTHKIERFGAILKDPLRPIFERQQRLDDWGERLHMACRHTFVQKTLALGGIKIPPPLIKGNQESLRQIEHRLHQIWDVLISKQESHLLFLGRQLESVSFKKTLERGFSLAQTDDGKIIQSLCDVPQSPFKLHLRDGVAKVQALLSQQGKLFD